MTLTIDADVVWKPRNIWNTVAPPVNQELELEQVRVVLMRVLSRYPEACTAVIGALEELGGPPWQPFPDTALRPSR